MTASVPNASISWNRVLPKPPALLGDYPEELPGRRNSSLLQHHIVSDRFTNDVLSGIGRRSTVPSISYTAGPRTIPADRSPSPDSNILTSNESTVLGPLTRKRTASLMASKSQSRATSPSALPIAVEPASQFCLCQPDPKIPRPRNAFILYRQHHQAAVVAQHPGLANPEISKIIGEQWRALPTKNKNEWKALAEEEKARHQQQYPDYRYQPRRYGRNGAVSDSVSGPSTDAAGNCLRCGGKTMNPPVTPSTPFTPSHANMPPPHLANVAPPRRQYTSLSGPPVPRPAILSPPSARVRPYGDVYNGGAPHPRELEYRARYGPSVAPPPPPRMSPEPKRRRFNGTGVYVPSRADMGPESPYPYSPRRTSLPRPEVLHPGGAQLPLAMAPPPPRSVYAHHANSQHQAMTRNDPSLTLPPLQTQSQNSSQGQKDGVEAMIMSIPVLGKIKTLSRVAPALAAPGPASPPFDVRGQIIAVEGSDRDNVRVLAEHLRAELSKSGDFAVRIFSGPEYQTHEGQEALVGLLTTISQWHQVSRDMIQFITTRQDSGFGSGAGSTHGEVEKSKVVEDDAGDATMAEADTEDESASAVSPKTIIPRTQDLSIRSPVSKTGATSTAPPRHKSAIPVAIISQYQLTTVDAASTSVPIQDSYSPTDHWQWIAALWRGCVGPDVSIVVTGSEGQDEGSGSLGPGVEVRLADRAVIVRKGKEEGAVAESSLRRVGFEVEECLRGDEGRR